MPDPITAWLWIGLILSIFTTLFVITLMYLFKDNANRTSFLNFETDNKMREYKIKLKKGQNKVKLGKGKYDLRKAIPFLKHSFFGDRQAFLTHYKFIQPLNVIDGNAVGESMDAETIDALTDMNVLDSFLRMEWIKHKKFGFIELIIGIAIGTMIGLLAHYGGVL